MKKSMLGPLLFAALSMGDWTVYVCADGNFTIGTPGIFEKKDLEKETKIGRLASHTFWFWDKSPDADNHLYFATYTDYPPGTVHSDSTALLPEFWEATLDEATRSLEAAEIYSGKQPFGQWPGMAWRLTYNKGTVSSRARAFLVKNRLYILQTICKSEHAMNNSSDRYFDSFRLISN